MKQFMIYILSILLIGILAILGILLFNSGDKPLPFLDDKGSILAGSISEKIFVNINGIHQGMLEV